VPRQSIRGFEIVATLGSGGMGVVYKARQPSLHRFVALKVLPPDKVSLPGFESRFEREARALAALTHPNIVGVHDFGKEGSLYFMALEYVEGQSLRELLAERPLSRDEVLQFLDQVCDALEYAHRAGVVHRDIKPGNILIGPTGRVKICDFGLAKMLDPSLPPMTQSGMALGTMHYMAPEQMENAREADPRADIYSTGVLVYEMLTGKLPGNRRDPPSRSALQPDLDLDRPVLRALAKNPGERYAAMAEFKEDIHKSAAPPGRREGSRRLWIALTAAFLVAGGGLGLGWKWIRKPAAPSAPPAASHPRPHLLTEHNPGGAAVVFSPDRSFIAAASYRDIDLRRAADSTILRTLVGHTAWVTCVAIHPDGSTLASGCHDGTIKQWSVQDGRELRTLSGHAQDVLCLTFSPDGKSLASGDAAGIVKLWNETGGTTFDESPGMVLALAYSPDGSILAVGSDGGAIRLWNRPQRRLVGRLDGHRGAIRSLAFRGDGGRLASASEDGTIRLWDVEKRELVQTLAGHAQTVCTVAFDAQGDRLGSGGRDKTARIWDLKAGSVPKSYPARTGWVVAVTFRGDGAFLFAEGFGARVGVP